jgi:FkbM family methyltransferase
MLNFAAIGNRSALGRLLRLPLRLIPPGLPLWIPQGPLRGWRWVSGSSTFGALLGHYEHEIQQQLLARLHPGAVVYDLGAHVGFHTLLASKLVGARGRVVAIEPDPANVRRLERHLALNHVRNVTVIQAAVSATPGTARFATNRNTQIGHLAAEGDVEVEVISLDVLVESRRLPLPTLVKMDVEGAESQALLGARRTLAAARPTLLFAVHANDTGEWWSVLRELRYRVEWLNPATGDYIGVYDPLAPPVPPWEREGRPVAPREAPRPG